MVGVAPCAGSGRARPPTTRTNYKPAFETASTRAGAILDGPNARITDAGLGQYDDAELPNLAVLGNSVYATWLDDRYGNDDSVFFACFTDGGATFSPSVALSPADAVNPHIALAPDGTLYATYSLDQDSDNNIILRKSSDLGQSWSEPQQLTNIDAADEVASWDLAVDGGGQIVLPWVEEFYGESNLNLATSSDGGASFATLVDIEDDQGEYPTVSDQREVAVALGSGEGADERAYVAWRDDRNVQDEIWFTRATLDGTPPTAPTNVQAQPGDTVIALSWQAATDANGVSGYRIYRAPDNGSGSADGPFVQISPLLVRGTGFVDVGLSADQPYLYQIAAVDGTGNLSPRSAVVSAAATVGDVQPSGTLIYERDDAARLHPMAGGEESAITDARDPVLSVDGTQLYYRSGDSIGVRPLATDGSLGEPQTFFTREGLADFDVAADGARFALLVQRFQANLNSGGCFVFEPIYANASQDLYTDQYNYSSHVSISADRRWMAYRYDGFCTINASGFTEPGDFCVVNLSTQEKKCIEDADIDGSDFAPGGSDIVFASPASGRHEIWRAQVADDGSLVNPMQLTSGPANQPADNPRFSSDGQWITFQRDVNPDTADDAEEWRLFAVRADGSSLRDLDVAGEEPVLLSGGSASAPDPTSTPAPGTTPAPQPTAQPTGGPTPTPLPEGVGTRTYLPLVAK